MLGRSHQSAAFASALDPDKGSSFYMERELPNYKSQPKPAQSMDQVLTLLHPEFSKRSTLEEAMMREMSESAQKSQRDCLKLLTRLRAASIDNAERDRYTQPVAERNRYTKLRTQCCFKPCAPPRFRATQPLPRMFGSQIGPGGGRRQPGLCGSMNACARARRLYFTTTLTLGNLSWAVAR